MQLNTSNEVKSFPKVHIQAGLYNSTLLEVKPSDDRIRFVMVIEDQKDPEGEPVTLVYSAPVGEEYNPNTKVGQIVLALGGKLGGNINTDALIGSQCQSKVEDYVKQVDRDGKKVTEVSSFVGEVYPLNEEEPSIEDKE